MARKIGRLTTRSQKRATCFTIYRAVYTIGCLTMTYLRILCWLLRQVICHQIGQNVHGEVNGSQWPGFSFHGPGQINLSWPKRIRATLRHVQSPITLYTKLDAECDLQVTIVGRLLTTLGHVSRRQVSSTTDRRLSLDVYRTWRRYIDVPNVSPEFRTKF